MVYKCLEVAKILESKNTSSKVVNMHTIKPIDKEAIKEACNSSLIVSVEEHNIIGGLGSAVSEHLSSLNQKPPLLSIGIPDEYGKAGSYVILLQKRLLLPDQIANTIANSYYSL